MDEIAEAFKLNNGKQIYSKKTLRNKIKIHNTGEEYYGTLDIADIHLHLILFKKGNKWVTTRSMWLEEKFHTYNYDQMQMLYKNVRKYRNNISSNK